MSSELKEYRLDEIAEILNHKRIPLNSRERKPGVYPYYGASGIVDYVEGYLFEGDYVLISEDGENLRSRNTPISFKVSGKFWVNNHAHILQGKDDFLNDFIVYYFQNFDLSPYVTGAVQPKLNKENLLSIPILIPDFKIAKKIIAILKSLDDKIELNRRINETLEGIAKALWGEWFGKYASGELELPVGWRWGKIGDVCQVNKNTLSKNTHLEWIDYVEISEVNRGKIGNITRYKRGMEPSRAKRKIIHGDVILSTVRPDRGAYFLSLHPQKSMVVSTGFAVFTAESVPYCFLYVLLTQDEMFDFYGQMADGGAYPAINPSVILEKELVIPDDKKLDEYQKIVEPIFEKIHRNHLESRTLTALRDALLPRLMKGEVLL